MWIIAYCPDVDEFFATDQREFYWEYDMEFPSELAAVKFFETHISDFLSVKNDILKDCIMGYEPETNVYLANTKKFYWEENYPKYVRIEDVSKAIRQEVPFPTSVKEHLDKISLDCVELEKEYPLDNFNVEFYNKNGTRFFKVKKC